MEPLPRDERARLVHLAPGVQVVRACSTAAVALFALQAALHVLPGSSKLPFNTLALVISLVGLLLSAAAAWIFWSRPPMTLIDGDGITVRTGWSSARQVPWIEVASVSPAASGVPLSTIGLTDGSRLTLPGVTRDDALWLADLVARTVSSRTAPRHDADDARAAPGSGPTRRSQ